MTDDPRPEKEPESFIDAENVTTMTPTSLALQEAGKSMLVDSLSTGREFCKLMIGASMSAIPVYLALLKFVLPEEYVPTLPAGLLALSPAVLFLAAGVVFVIAYFPQTSAVSLDLTSDIENLRRMTIRRRHCWSLVGFVLFCVAVISGLVVTGLMLRIAGNAGL